MKIPVVKSALEFVARTSTVDRMMDRYRANQPTEAFAVEVSEKLDIEVRNPMLHFNEEDAKLKIANSLSGLAPKRRAAVIDHMKRKFEADLSALTQKRDKQAARQDLLERHILALEALKDWTPPLQLERNDCSRLHKVKDCLQHFAEIALGDDDFDPIVRTRLMDCNQSFVIQHDWAQAFAGAQDFEGDDIKLPYPTCVFEFRIGGRTVMLFFTEAEGALVHSLIIECGESWLSPPGHVEDGWADFLRQQVRAVCVALDADVAVERVERAPAALNKKRERAGRRPLPDYSVVDLSKRHRIANPATPSSETGIKRRMHFRRGHWRHYENHRTWIKWQLVGNPDLGFINKHYRL